MKLLVIFALFGAALAFPKRPIVQTFDDTRIVGGEEAELGEVPWQGMLFRFGSFICGCSLLDEYNVITAAHCVHPYQDSHWYFEAAFGRITLNPGNGDLPNVHFSRIYRHEDYSSSQIYNDVAIMHMDQPMTLTNTVKGIRLASDNNEQYEGRMGHTSGFGRIYGGGPVSPVLLTGYNMPILSNTECKVYWGSFIQPGMICAGQGDPTVCNGDSGGPLWVMDDADDEPTLVGVTSWSVTGCQIAGKTYPDGWARVTYYYDWIVAHLA